MKTSRKFRKWVRDRGVTKTAADLGMNRVNVHNWLTVHRPSEDKLARIFKLAEAEGVTLTPSDVGYKMPALT